MSNDFFIPEERLATLKATPAGRSGEGGYNYQRAYAVARLASMHTAQALLGLSDYPKRLRYDWADDLDELLGSGSVCFTQCKRVDDIGAPAKLAEILSGFAPKWLWTPEPKRAQIRFRLVSCDPRFVHDFEKDAERAKVLANFKAQLAIIPTPQSDRAKWQREADSIGHERLFDSLWQSLEFVYAAKEVVLNDPAGALLPAERAALDHLMQWSVIWGGTQIDALVRLRRLIQENLITFESADQTETGHSPPRTIDAAEVRVALFARDKDAPSLPFTVVDRIYLANARRVERKRFLFEAPEWHHVVHGADEHLKFIERDQTASLAMEVRERLIAPLRRGTGSMSAIFVTGPPGAGKSTLVRCVAAQLIEAGEVVVADAGHNLTNVVPGDVELYFQHLTRLAQQGRPVLLVLDDPLCAESEWIELLRHLKKPDLQLAVIAPTPDFLYHSHKHELRGVQVYSFPVNPPSASEKQALARLYGHALNHSYTLPDDFLVMVAELAEGKPFPEIMQRLWETLNGGQGINGSVLFKDLPLPVRAFWFVCVLHRAYTPFPMPILQAALAQSGGADNLDVSTSLAKLKAQGGWSIFRILQPTSAVFGGAGELVSTAHQKIASVAWERRPGAWLDREVNHLIAEATLRVPKSVLYVAAAAGTLTKAKSNPDSMLADELTKQWVQAAAKERRLETRDLCVLSATLQINGGREFAQRMLPSFLHRATGNDGWLAALQLHYLSADKLQERSFPSSVRLSILIADANFSIAPNRAIQFFNAVKGKECFDAIVSRLCASLDEKLDWQIDPTLLTWLISHASLSEINCRLDRLQHWLAAHEDDTYVRTQYLAFLQQLPKEKPFDQLREHTATKTAKWLDDHEDDTYVRTQYLAFLQQLPKEKQFDQLREQTTTKTAKWLDDHEDDTYVRTQYLAFLQQLPKEKQFDQLREHTATKTAKWLDDHEDDTTVRTQYLAFIQQLPKEKQFDQLREQTTTKTAKWLDDHEDDTTVRTQYLAFLQQLPKEKQFDQLREQTTTKTAKWLDDHEDDTTVRAQYLAFIQQLPKEKQFDQLREQTATKTAKWLDDHEDDTTVRTQFLSFVQKLPSVFDEMHNHTALNTAEWLKKHPENFDVCTGYVNFLLAIRHPDLAALEAESIPLHDWIISKNPKQVGHRLTYGNQLLRLEKFVEAKIEFEQVLARKPQHQLAHRGLATALQHLGMLKEAEDSFKQALFWAKEKRGNLAMFHTSLGVFYLNQNRWQEAIKSFGEAGKESPEYYGNHWGVAKAQNELGKLPEAKQSLERALADPELRLPVKGEIEQMYAEILQQISASQEG